MVKVVPVVLAGGSGTRLWPLSRTQFPKQFLSLVGEQTMLQQTILRLNTLSTSTPMVICNEEHRFIAAEQLRAIDTPATIVLEPCGRNTAPALAIASLLSSQDDDPLLLVLAADHVIEDTTAFVDSIQRAIPMANSGKLVTFGIVPDSAHTGYGYIRTGAVIDAGHEVAQFVEKPSATVAQQYLDSGEYLWNSGMFLFRASRYLAELNQYRSDIASACEAAVATTESDLDFLRLDNDAFRACPAESIDFAVMERTKDAVVVPLNVGWNDIGAWSALWQVSAKSDEGNVVRGDNLLHDVSGCFLHGEERLIAAVGITDLVVIDTPDVLLVSDRERAQEVKHLVEQLKGQERQELNCHRKVFRPWGYYDSIDTGNRYQVKHITVKPGAKLSVQMHHHRAEHWVVVSGTAKVTNGDKTFLVAENESTYIPIGVVHALENPGKVPLELIEVQSGSYLGEDDIIRFEDNYGRCK
ncbi:mannose-1-phosphate guanylyltransferase/mannose-6-phosphate isomerase [Ferrimonas lipolytica]|uniref:mannose-1-phosphate guanylyltransferase n=1 Tax=Ferrimonas lipolytica TaxID=2724191 RepID=A0A6H1UIL5_9GAMM|nr:mannose-1-phosphate guanylyltransferase/mannose-6-phosphate isomerase [Ferrimonas lipolytica]QIZ78450.1 mannose-1-phosphate guanylyltransferase/mannose-6-phosphate isomerase [Ferrimonas lipolytica]